MPRGTCQFGSFFEALPDRDTPPCMTCMRRERCSSNSELQQLLARNNLRHAKKVPVVVYCSQCLPWSSPSTDLRGSLRGAGVRHLCDGCAEAKECVENFDLREIERLAEIDGRHIEIAVVTCVSGLIQIGQGAREGD